MAKEITEKYLIQKQVIYALARMSPMAPILHSGKYGHKYDNYTCANCGASVNEIVYHFCPNCGQRLTDASLGKRQTEEERKKYAQMRIFDLFREEIAHDNRRGN